MAPHYKKNMPKSYLFIFFLAMQCVGSWFLSRDQAHAPYFGNSECLFLFFKFIFDSTGSLLLHIGFLQLQTVGATLLFLFSWSTGSRCMGFSSSDLRAPECWLQLLCGRWKLPTPGIEPVSTALTGRFLSTVPPGKSKSYC